MAIHLLSSSAASGAQVQEEGAADVISKQEVQQQHSGLTLGQVPVNPTQPTGQTPYLTVSEPGAGLSPPVTYQVVSSTDAVKLNTGEYVSKTDFDKLSPADQALLMQIGIEKFNQQKQTDLQNFLNNNIKLSTGEYISKEAFARLSPADQQLLMSLGVERFNQQKQAEYQAFASQNTQLPNGEWIPNQFYNDLTPQAIQALASGTAAFNQWLVGKTPTDVFLDGGWKPDFNKPNPYEGMPFWYQAWEDSNFIPTPDTPNPPSSGYVGGTSSPPVIGGVQVSTVPGAGTTTGWKPDFNSPNPFEGAPLSYYQQEIAGYIPTATNPLPPSLSYLQANPNTQLVAPTPPLSPQPFSQSEFIAYQMASPEQKFNLLMSKGYIPKGSEFAGVDEQGQILFLTPDNVVRNKLSDIWNKRVNELTVEQAKQNKDYEAQIKAFETKLKDAPKELQDAYAKGGITEYLAVAKKYDDAIANIQAELAPYKSTVLPPYKAGYTPEMLKALSKDSYNIQQYLIDNKNSAEALQKLKILNFDQVSVQQASDNAQIVLNTVAHISKLVNLPNIKSGSVIGVGGQDVQSLRRIADELGLLKSGVSGVVIINGQPNLLHPDKFWDSLSDSQKQEIAIRFASDPYKSTYFASTVASWNLAASKNLGLGIIISPLTAIGTPIAKVTIPDSAIASQIKDSITYLNQAPTLSPDDNKALNQAIKAAGLSGTGLDAWKSLSSVDKQKVATQFTRNQLGIKPTSGEWVQAGLMAAATALPFLRLAPVIGGVARIAEIPVGLGMYGTGMQSYIQNFNKLTPMEKAVYGGMLALPTALLVKGTGEAVVYAGRKTIAPFIGTYDMESVRLGKGMPHTELAPGIGKALGIDETKTGVISLEKAKVDILTRDPEGNYVTRPTPLERGISLTKEANEKNVIINTSLDTSYMYAKDAAGNPIVPKTITDPIKYTVDVPRTGGALKFMGRGEYSSINAWPERGESVATSPLGKPKLQFVATLVDKFNKTPEDVQALQDAGKVEEAGRLFIEKEMNGELAPGHYLPFRTIQGKVIEPEVVTPHGTEMYVVGRQYVWADKNYWRVDPEKATKLSTPEGFDDWSVDKQTKWYADRGAATKLAGKGDRIPMTFVSRDPTAKPPDVLTRMTVEWGTEPYTRIKRFLQMFDPNRLPKITTESGETSRLPRLAPIDAKATNEGQVHVQSPTEYYGVKVVGGVDNGTGLVVLGDRHGVYRGMRDMINNGFDKDIVDRAGNWIGQKEHIVQVGDIVDRGKYYAAVRQFFNNLQEQSAKTGGQVDRLLGNHELAYLTGDEISGIDYSNPRTVAKIRQSVINDILSGKIKAATVDNGQLFTHAGVSLDRFPEFRGKDAQFIAANLNKRLLDAVKNKNYSDPIFAKGAFEGGKGAGGIFWLRPRESSPEATNLGYKQFYGHTPEMTFEGKSWAIQERSPNAIDVETAAWWDRPLKDKSMLAYYDTPTMKTMPTGAMLAKPGEGSYITLPFEDAKVQLQGLRKAITEKMGNSVDLYPDSQVGLTIKIPDGLSEAQLMELNAKLQAILKDSEGKLSFGTVGGYPSNYDPAYLYLGLKDDRSLAFLVDLQKKVDRLAESLGYKAGDIKLQAGMTLGDVRGDYRLASDSLQKIMREQPDDIVTARINQFKEPERLAVNKVDESVKKLLKSKIDETNRASQAELLSEDSPPRTPLDYTEGELGSADNGVIAIRPESLGLTRFAEYKQTGDLPRGEQPIEDIPPELPSEIPEVPSDKIGVEQIPTEVSPVESIPTEVFPSEQIPTEIIPSEKIPTEVPPTEIVRPEPITPYPPEPVTPEPVIPEPVAPYPPSPPYPPTPPYGPPPPEPPPPPYPPEPPIPPIPPTSPARPAPPVVKMPDEWSKSGVPKGTIEWRQGRKWVALPPPYRDEDKLYLDNPLPGTYKFAVGKGSAAKTLQIINGTGAEDADIDMGWARVHIKARGRDLEMDFTGGEEAANDRWAMEEQYMDELDRQSYQDIPPVDVTERIPRYRQPMSLNKRELPEFSTDGLRVYSVNGAYIRSAYANRSIGDRNGVDFTQGGHSLVYWKLIPENEIWIDQSLQGADRDATILHEIEERNQMSQGMDYSEAHNDYANKLEIEGRENPKEIDDMINEILAKNAQQTEVKAPKRVYSRGRQKVIQDNSSIQIPERRYLGRRLRPVSLS